MSVGALGQFQNDFARALFAQPSEPHFAAVTAQPGFAVYRNTVIKACVDALHANFPAVARLVGDEWLRAAAAVYARRYPPRDPRLVLYGEHFAAFLESFEPAAELPYLSGIARLDYCWCEAHVAREDTRLAGDEIASRAPEVLSRTILRPHAAARWAWFDDGPIATLWSANRTSDEAGIDLSAIAWHADGALITRPVAQVTHVLVDRATCVFLDACRAGKTVEQAALASLNADPRVDLSELMASLIAAGAFASLENQPEEQGR